MVLFMTVKLDMVLACGGGLIAYCISCLLSVGFGLKRPDLYSNVPEISHSIFSPSVEEDCRVSVTEHVYQ